MYFYLLSHAKCCVSTVLSSVDKGSFVDMLKGQRTPTTQSSSSKVPGASTSGGRASKVHILCECVSVLHNAQMCGFCAPSHCNGLAAILSQWPFSHNFMAVGVCCSLGLNSPNMKWDSHFMFGESSVICHLLEDQLHQ